MALMEPFDSLFRVAIAPGNPHLIGWETVFIERVLEVGRRGGGG